MVRRICDYSIPVRFPKFVNILIEHLKFHWSNNARESRDPEKVFLKIAVLENQKQSLGFVLLKRHS